jgi:hypothetical protein
MFSGIVSSIDFYIVGPNLVSSLMSSFIRKLPYSILVKYMHLSNLIFNFFVSFVTSVANFSYTSL